MNQELALRVLSQIMSWSDDQARKEFQWLRLMARLKYDGYRDFQAGMRFVESLATWLQQFANDERETAYDFVRRNLVYIGPGEMKRLVEQFYPRTVRERLFRTIAAERSIQMYELLADIAARADVDRLRRQTLFMGLSDGARTDTIRHENVGVLSNEQLVQSTQIDLEKWRDLQKKLHEDLDDAQAAFRLVYLVDDFTATGTSFLRKKDDGAWTGKLKRFHESVVQVVNQVDGPLLDEDWELCIHHYVASTYAVGQIQSNLDEAKTAFAGKNWAKRVHVSFGLILPEQLPIDTEANQYKDFIALTDKYYDPAIETEATLVGGKKHLGLGYGGCALPVILDHNTPNNSVALLWAETEGEKGDDDATPAMRPLFRRRQRHG